MNYLAHSVLADSDDKLLLGSLLGDSWRGLPGSVPDPRVRIGLMLHRRLDQFTDDHAAFIRSRERLRPHYRRYAGIVVDVFYDHVLARHWQVFRADPAPVFAQRIYDLLDRHHADLPLKLQRFSSYMQERELLTAYAESTVIEEVLTGLSKRLTRANPLADAIEELHRCGEGFKADFFEFFPHAMHASRQLHRAIRKEVYLSANNQPVQA